MKNKTREKLTVIMGNRCISRINMWIWVFTKDTTWMLMCMICTGGMALSSVLLGSIRIGERLEKVEELLKIKK